MLADGISVHPACTRQANFLLPQHFERELVIAGTDRLDETKLGGALQQVVAPESRNHENIGFTDSFLRLLGVPSLEVPQTHIETLKSRCHLVGNVRETDR